MPVKPLFFISIDIYNIYEVKFPHIYINFINGLFLNVTTYPYELIKVITESVSK